MSRLENDYEGPTRGKQSDQKFRADEQTQRKAKGRHPARSSLPASPVLFSVLIWLLGLLGVGWIIRTQLGSTASIGQETKPLVPDPAAAPARLNGSSAEMTNRELLIILAKQASNKINDRSFVQQTDTVSGK